MAIPPYKDTGLPWENVLLPWKQEAQPWNNPILPWQKGSGIQLSSQTITETASTGVSVGTLSVIGGTGTYTFTITADPSSKFDVNGSNGTNLFNDAAIDYETTPSLSVTIHADNGSGSTFDRTFTISVANVAAPVLTSPIDTKTSDTTADLSVATDVGTGMMYVVVVTGATPPSAAQVKAGQDSGGSAAQFTASASASIGANLFSATGLAGGTQYYSYFMHESAPAEQSTVAAADGFLTDSSPLDGFLLLLEAGSDYLLLETSDKLVLES